MPRIPHLPATGDYAYMNIFYRQNGKLLSVKLWWTGSTPVPSGFDPVAAGTALYTPLSTAFTGVFTNHTEIDGWKLSVRNATMQWSAQNYVNAPGLVSGFNLPDEVNVILQRITDQPGASNRGRLRLSGVPESFFDGNYLNSTGNTAYVGLCTALKAAVTNQTVTWSPAHFSPKEMALHAAINFTINDLSGTNRRRRLRF